MTLAAAPPRERGAERLFARDGVDAVSMDQVAAEAGVGKGTLFRRFGDRAGLLDTHLDLIRVSETASPGARYRIGAYRFWHAHVAILLRAARPDLDGDYLAHALLAPLAADLHAALRAEIPPHRATTGLATLATALLDSGRPATGDRR